MEIIFKNCFQLFAIYPLSNYWGGVCKEQLELVSRVIPQQLNLLPNFIINSFYKHRTIPSVVHSYFIDL